jgi:hypothetical protein
MFFFPGLPIGGRAIPRVLLNGIESVVLFCKNSPVIYFINLISYFIRLTKDVKFYVNLNICKFKYILTPNNVYVHPIFDKIKTCIYFME